MAVLFSVHKAYREFCMEDLHTTYFLLMNLKNILRIKIYTNMYSPNH